MTDILKTALGTTYCMFYHPAVNTNLLTPVQTLSGSCDVANWALKLHGPDVLTWPAGLQDEVARLLRVNYFYQNLTHEPIRKPILVHQQQQTLVVDCGDTRLMTVQLMPGPTTVSVVITCVASNAGKYNDWHPITSDSDLIKLTNFDSINARILTRPSEPGSDYAIEWLEIGDGSTGHHLHSLDLRLKMMQQYLSTQPQGFKFTPEWVKTPVTWIEFA
jgi:hypothetical protein